MRGFLLIAMCSNVLYISVTVKYLRADIANSVDSLRNILKVHKDHLMSNYVNENYGENCNLFAKHDFNFDERIVEHPIAAYVLIKCLVKYKAKGFEQDIHRYLSEVEPTDHEAVALSLVRLQETYDLNVQDLLDGRLLDYQSNFTLTPDDCLAMAKQALNQLNLKSADTWLKACERVISSDDFESRSASSSSSMVNLHQLMTTLEQLSKLLRDKSTRNSRIVEYFPDLNQDAVLMLNEPEEVVEIKRRLKHNTNLLCQGLRDKSNQTGRTCGFQRNPRSWVPHRVERVHDDPEILLYHRVLEDKEIYHIKRMSLSKFSVSKVHRFNNHEPFASSRRVGKGAFLPANSSATLSRLYHRVEDILGLTTQSAEDLQVHNYGVGGHYEVHMDFIDSNKKGIDLATGDRIATFLIYLNDVEYGGATAFPQLGTAVQPVKGAALTWDNLKTDGTGDYRTLHAACPLLMGTKWIATVWLHEHGQEFRRPCTKK